MTEVKSKVYKAVKKDGKCILVKKQRPKPKVTKVKPQPVKSAVGALTQVPTAERQALAVKRELDIQKRALTEASKKTAQKEQQIDNIIRQLLHKGVPPKIEPTKQDIAKDIAKEDVSDSLPSRLPSSDDTDFEGIFNKKPHKTARKKLRDMYKNATITEMESGLKQFEIDIKKLEKDYNNASTLKIRKTIKQAGDRLVSQFDELITQHMIKISTKDDSSTSFETPPEIEELPSPPPEDEPIIEEEIAGEGNGKIEGGLMNTEIDDMMKSTKSFKGSIPADMIPSLPSNKVMNFIINKDKSGEPGSHWCAVYIDSVYDKECCYYDPLGNPPSKEVERDLKDLVKRINPRHKLKFKVNTMRNQKNSTDTCGFMCMRFLKDMIAGKSFKDATGYCNKHNKDNSNHFEDKAEKLANKFGYI